MNDLQAQPPLDAAAAAPIPPTAPTAPTADRARPVRAADEIVNLLVKSGVRTIFGLPGGAISPIYDALLDHPEIRVINCKHETMAVFAAAAHSRATESVGIVLVTSGPGVTNAITGLASAHCDGLPIVLLAGEVPTSQFGRGALQEGSAYSIGLRGMLQSVTKASFDLTAAKSAAATLSKALATARSGRKGAVFVSLPFDLLRETIEPPRIGAQVSSQFIVDAPLLDEAADLLASAERPLIVAGSGTRWGQGPEMLRRLAERGRIPVITTPKAKGVFPESSPLALGIYGFGGHPSAQRYLEQGVDVLLAVGTGFGEVSTNAWDEVIQASRSLLHIDIDALQIGRNYRTDMGLVGPAEVLLRQLLERVPQSRRLLSVNGVERLERIAEDGSGGPGLSMPEALCALQRAMPPDTIYCGDVGDHLLFALHYLTIERPDAFYFSGGFGSMGSGLGAAIGAKLAMPDRPVACICGDGTLSMFGTELLTAAQEQLGIVFAVMNDGGYGMVERFCEQILGRTPPFRLPGFDISGFGRSLGIRSQRIDHASELPALDTNGAPLLLDFNITRAAAVPQKGRFDASMEAPSTRKALAA
ncbi:MAG: thiamine pyrophosphate-binding protein [Deltaproteobacteria bacterium]